MEPNEDQFNSDAEADGDALASCGWGTDEDYGYYGHDFDWWASLVSLSSLSVVVAERALERAPAFEIVPQNKKQKKVFGAMAKFFCLFFETAI